MDLEQFYDNEKNEIQVVEDQLVLANSMKEKLIELETQKKQIDEAQKEMKKQLEEVMRANNITGYESNDKRIKITLGEDTTSCDIDKDYLWEKYPDIYRECNTKETKRKGSLRITIREVEA